MSILLEYCNDLVPITEAFYGKPKEFIEIEKKLDKIIEMIQLSFSLPNKAIPINDMKEVKEIENIFTNFFNNAETSISFYSIGNLYNAYTYPSFLSFFRKDKNNKRLVRANDLFINVNIDIGLVYKLDMTAGELMAIILHEIGHCFDASLFMLLSKINIDLIDSWKELGEKLNIEIPSELLSIGSTIFAGSKLNMRITQYMNKVSIPPSLAVFLNTFFSFIDEVKIVSGRFRSMMHILRKGYFVPYIKSIINPRNIFGYANEKFADSFASTYGYSTELSQFILKIDKSKGQAIDPAIQSIPIINIGYDFTKVNLMVCAMMCSPHPSNPSRIQSQLNKLKRDVNNPDLDHKVKKELEKNIQDLENFIDNEYLNFDSNDNKLRPISFVYNWIIIKIFKGKLDPRELFELVFNHEL